MFENLEDGVIGAGGSPGEDDAEYSGTITTEFDNGGSAGTTPPNAAGDGDVDNNAVTTSDLKRYDHRSATNFDLGGSRPLSDEMTLGARIFYKNDNLNRHHEGTTTVITNAKATVGVGEPLVETGRVTTTYSGLGDNAAQSRDVGVSGNLDWHPDDRTWALNGRLDVFSTRVNNPPSGLSTPARDDHDWDWVVGEDVSFQQITVGEVLTQAGGFNPGATNGNYSGTGDLAANTTENSWITSSKAGGAGFHTSSVNDERTGIGINLMGEFDFPWASGDTRVWAGFGRRPYSVDATIVEQDIQAYEMAWNDGTNGDQRGVYYADNDTRTTTRNGDSNQTILEGGGRWLRNVSRTVSVGVGAIVTRTKWNEDYTQTQTTMNVTSFDDGFGTRFGDELLGGPLTPTSNGAPLPGSGVAEFETISTTTEVQNIKDETTVNTFRFPVGTQWNITRKITANLGVSHAVSRATREIERNVAPDGKGQTVTITTDSAGAGTPVYSTGGEDVVADKVTDRDEWRNTTFWYGLEFLIGSAAQVNINGFFEEDDGSFSPGFSDERSLLDLSFFRNLALSITFMFD